MLNGGKATRHAVGYKSSKYVIGGGEFSGESMIDATLRSDSVPECMYACAEMKARSWGRMGFEHVAPAVCGAPKEGGILGTRLAGQHHGGGVGR